NQCSGLSMQWRTRCVPSENFTMPFFTFAVSVPLTRTLPAKRPAREFGLVVWPTMPTLLEKPTTPTLVFDVPMTPGRVSDEPKAPAVIPILGIDDGPCVPEMPLTPVRAPEMLCTPGPKNDTARTAAPANDAPCAPSPSREKPMTPGWITSAP